MLGAFSAGFPQTASQIPLKKQLVNIVCGKNQPFVAERECAFSQRHRRDPVILGDDQVSRGSQLNQFVVGSIGSLTNGYDGSIVIFQQMAVICDQNQRNMLLLSFCPDQLPYRTGVGVDQYFALKQTSPSFMICPYIQLWIRFPMILYHNSSQMTNYFRKIRQNDGIMRNLLSWTKVLGKDLTFIL